MSEILRVLNGLGGVGRRADLERAGVRRAEIDIAVRRGDALRVRKGVYASPGTDPAVVTAARHGGEVACGAALRAHDVWVLDGPASTDDRESGQDANATSALHVWVGPSGREHPHAGCRCRVHHEIGDGVAGFGVVGVLLALVQYAACASSERFFASLESAMRLGLIGRAGLDVLRMRLPEAKRWLVDFASDQADSGLESLLRLRLHLHGISLQSQVVIPGIGPVDFLLAGCIILEADGKDNHDGPSKRHKDLMRDAIAAAQGYETLRFDYAMIIFEWGRVLAAIEGRLAVLQNAGAAAAHADMQDGLA